MDLFGNEITFPLKAIRIKNFKSLKDTGFINIAKFNLIFGKNGSGKSSFLLALRFLSQIVSSHQKEREQLIFNLSTKLNLGSYAQLVCDGDESKEIIIELIFDSSEGDAFNLEHHLYKSKTRLKIGFVFAAYKVDKTKLILSKWSIDDLENGMKLEVDREQSCSNLSFGKFTKEDSSKKDKQMELEEIGELSKDGLTNLENLFNAVLIHSHLFYNVFFKRESTDSFNEFGEFGYYSKAEKDAIVDYLTKYLGENIEESDFFWQEEDELEIKETRFYLEHELLFKIIEVFISPHLELSNKFLQELQKIDHIPHIRSEFPRAFVMGDLKNTKWENNLITDLKNLLDSDFYSSESLKKIMRNLNLCEDLIIEEHNGVFQIFLYSNGNKINVADTSSGFKQVFPLIIKIINYPYEESLLDQTNTILLVEQPELHLHPKLQADLLEEIVLADTGVQLIIETHSETMLRKLQVLIAKKEISGKDVSVYFFDNPENDIRVSKIDFDDNGFFTNPLPAGFFDESYELTEELLKVVRSN